MVKQVIFNVNLVAHSLRASMLLVCLSEMKIRKKVKFCVVAQPLNKSSLNLGLLYDYAQRTIYGNYTGSRKDMKNMLAFSARHNIESIVDVMPFSKLNEAIDLVKAGKIAMRLVVNNTD